MSNYGTFDPTSLLVGPCPKHRHVTIAAGSNASGAVLVRGTLLGRITATDKYIPCVRTASDGSQTPAVIVAADIDASAADVVGPAYDDVEIAAELLTIDASWTIATLQAALRQAGSRIYARSVGQNG